MALAACSADGAASGSASDTPASGETSTGIVTANGTEPQNPLIPANTNEVGGGRIVDLLFAGLVSYDVDGNTQNEMAESITSDDNKTWTIKLKPGQKFSDGTDVKASNFVDAWKLGAKNAMISSSFYSHITGANDDGTGDLTGLKAVDDTTFTVELKDAEADFPIQLGYSAFYPLPDSTLADVKNGGEHPVGNGPYMMASDTAWQHNVQVDLVPNPNYDGPRKAKNGGITFKFYTSNDAAYADLQSDNLDVLDDIPAASLSTFQDDLAGRAINQPAAIWQGFTIDMNAKHFTGEEGQLRRQAISMAIDRDSITKTIFYGTSTPAKDYSSPTIPGYSDSLPGSDVVTYNPDKAKELWAQADAISKWDGQFTIAYNSDSSHQVWVDAATNSIKNTLGIDAEGAPYPDFKSFRDDVTAGKILNGARSGWQADYPSLYNFLQPLYATGASSNDSHYSNPEVDKLFTEASAQKTTDEFNATLQKVEEQLLKDLPAIPLWYQNARGGYSTLVSNVKVDWHSVPQYYNIVKQG